MKTYLVILASVLLVLSMVGVGFGATQQTVSATVSVPGVLSITASSMVFGEVSPSAVGTDTLDLTVDSNTDYDVNAKSLADYFDKDTLADTTIEDGDLEWSDGAGTPTWTGYSQTPATIASGSAGAEQTPSVDHRLNVPGSAEAGDYDLDITVSIVAA